MNSIALKGQSPAHLRDAASDAAPAARADDMAMIRAAAELTRDLNTPNPIIYWSDLIASSAIGYAAMWYAIAVQPIWATVMFSIVAIFALYRAGSFIHELTHLRPQALPGFRFGWNALIGIPMLVPSFLYEGLHNLHHARTRYGTAEDPEYLPLASMRPWTVAVFLLVATIGPIGLLLRFGIVGPLSAIIPPLRRLIVEKYSGLVINSDFRRRPPEGEFRRQWLVQETLASVWAMTILGLVATQIIPLRAFVIVCAIVAATVILNQVRTLVAHLWENEGEPMSQTAQFLDSVNVPPPATLPALWAPVGLRYHAIHHLLPGLPYHSLGEAHRRISQALGPGSTYGRASYGGLWGLVYRLVSSTLGRGSARS
jgi:fatty acid desaturase